MFGESKKLKQVRKHRADLFEINWQLKHLLVLNGIKTPKFHTIETCSGRFSFKRKQTITGLLSEVLKEEKELLELIEKYNNEVITKVFK